MQFYPWQLDWNDYQTFCRVTGQRSDYKNQEEFYISRAKQAQRLNWGSARNAAEQIWIKEGQPYYNVHPLLVSKLCRVNLSSIPAHLVEIPGEFNAVNIRLAEQHSELTMTEETNVTAAVKWANQISAVPVGAWVHSILMVRPTKRILEFCRLPIFDDPKKFVLFYFDFNILTKDCIRTWGIAPILWRTEEDTLEDALTAQKFLAKETKEGYTRMVGNAMRLAVTIGFMANANDGLIEPDVLSKDRFAFERATNEERQIIVDRAKRRGKIGYNVGNDLIFLGQVPGHATNESRESAGGRRLLYAHIRGGHPHPVRYGPGKNKAKIMWFRPTTVRKDLPFKP